MSQDQNHLNHATWVARARDLRSRWPVLTPKAVYSIRWACPATQGSAGFVRFARSPPDSARIIEAAVGGRASRQLPRLFRCPDFQPCAPAVYTQRCTASAVSVGFVLKHSFVEAGACRWMTLISFSNKRK